MKLVWGLIFLLFFAPATADGIIYYTSYNNFHNALDLALDAGLIAGIIEEDSRHGRIIIDENKGYLAARKELEKNLKLDNNLINDLYKNSSFDFQIIMQGEKPVAKGDFKTHILFHAGKIFGIDSIPLNITKECDFVSSYV